MAAYAALVSLMHIIDDLDHHPRPPISLRKQHTVSLTAKATFLKEFLEDYNPSLSYSTKADPLETRIADAAYAVRDAIESHIVDTITNDGEEICSGALYVALEKAIGDMALIGKEAMEIKETMGVKYQHLGKSTPPLDSFGNSSSTVQKKCSMVGADGVLLEMKDKLTSDRTNLQTIPIVGMGGSGKTTLALNIYQDGLIKEHFHTCAWATVSQVYNIREVLIQLLTQLIKDINQDLSDENLGEMLYRKLCGRRYLIILDDMWGIDAWNEVRNYFPNNQNGSRIIVTTRLSNLAFELSNSNSLEMSLLDESDSWILLFKTVFGEIGLWEEIGSCPPRFEEIGKKIAKCCKGLPLSIVMVGGILAKSEQTIEFWEYIEVNLNSIVNLEDGDRCLKILYMSYRQLPVHLKPCFLYMGVFPEDAVIRISKLVRLSEGFLPATSGKSLEEIAKEYLKDLIDRNLVMIHKMGITGSIKECKVHDLLRDLCLREAQKQRFYSVIARPHTALGIAINAQRRTVISNAISTLMLMRTLHAYGPAVGFSESMQQIVNTRLLSFPVDKFPFLSRKGETPSSLSLIWNLQTLSLARHCATEPTDIWHMPHIRHVHCPGGIHLPTPLLTDGQDDIVLGNLQTLGDVRSFELSEQVIKKIPNIRKLKMTFYDADQKRLNWNRYRLTSLDCLDKLESLTCNFHLPMNPSGPNSLPSLINFPRSLRQLSLYINNSPMLARNVGKDRCVAPSSEAPVLRSGLQRKGVDNNSRPIPPTKTLAPWRMQGSKTLDSRKLPLSGARAHCS